MMLYKNTKVKVCSLDRDGLLWHCCWCSARGCISPISVPNLPILPTWMSIDLMKENGFTLKKQEADDTHTNTDADYTDDIALLVNTPTQVHLLLHSLEEAVGGIGFHVNADKMEYMYFNQKGYISTLNGGSLKLRDKFTYLRRSISFTENDIEMRLAKAWTAFDSLWIIWKSDLFDKIKHNFFQAVVISILLYGCTTWTLTKHIEKKLDENCKRMLWTMLSKSKNQHPTKQQLYSHLPPISKTIYIRQKRHVKQCWRSKDKLISDILLWSPPHGCASVRQLIRTYLQQFCMDTGCSLEDLPEVMDDRDKCFGGESLFLQTVNTKLSSDCSNQGNKKKVE